MKDPMKNAIRVGLIRCDTHGMYFGAQMDDHDSSLLREPMPPSPKNRYSWQNGGVHHYFYTSYCRPWQMSVPSVNGFQIAKVWDEDRTSAEAFVRVFRGRPELCDSFRDVSEGVDLVFIADCNGDGSDHLKLATPGLKKGIPTYIDKPLAFTTADVRRLLALSKKHRAPLFSCSILPALPQVARFVASLPQTGGVHAGIVEGGGTHLAGQIHAISLAQAVFGNGIESVRAMGANGAEVVHLSYGARRDRPQHGVVLHSHVGPMFHCSFHVSAYGPDCAMHTPTVINDFFFPQGSAHILKMCRNMVRTGRVPNVMDDMVEAIAVAEACRTAVRTGRSAAVRSLKTVYPS
jgi:predicted dehydrogenase